MTSISSNVSPLCSVRISVAPEAVIVSEAVLASIGGQAMAGCPVAPGIADRGCVRVLHSPLPAVPKPRYPLPQRVKGHDERGAVPRALDALEPRRVL